ncbi:MAG: biotin synthase BioB [bacterium]|nr:biotin synthase BioB [bacterium]
MFRYDWSKAEVQQIYNQPFPELIFQAMTVHRGHFPGNKIQRSTLLSIKTGFCPEDCSYCPQSAHYDTKIDKHGLLPKEFVMEKAAQAKEKGSTRFCMGAAWREIKDGDQFDAVLDIVSSVASLDMEVCCTMGMLTDSQAERLKDAGCHAYNHNLDTSPEYYGNIISTRTYQDRLDTLKRVRSAGMTVCSGGIVGMGESIEDRLELLRQLATQSPHPESVPLNMLIRVEGTPLADEQQAVDGIEFVRLVATARILMPGSLVRLSAGRTQMSDETQALAFVAGANSIHSGDKLLTTANPGDDHDDMLIKKLGMSFVGKEDGCGCGHKEHHHDHQHAANS